MGNPQNPPLTCGVPLIRLVETPWGVRFDHQGKIITVYAEDAVITELEPNRKKVIDREPNA
jgi:hypothetical protein